MLETDSVRVSAVNATKGQTASGCLTLDMLKRAGYEIILRQTGFDDEKGIVLERAWTGNYSPLHVEKHAGRARSV